MKKSERQALIRQLITQQDVETQEELLTLLESEGVKATQATISRDIREMSIIKTHSPLGNLRYSIFVQTNSSTEERLDEAIQDSVTSVEQIEFTNLIRTNMGSADVVAALIDDLEFPEVAGTIAGVDTIFVISRTKEEAAQFFQRVHRQIL